MPVPAAAPAELLAPAGDEDSLRAAVANGADAVYFGVSDFNARRRAANFAIADLPRVVAYLHDHNVRAYLACNTLIFSDELAEAVALITAAARAGVDAVIVQDLGLAHLAKRLAPGLTLHGSTQMTLTEPRGIAWVRELGVERVILARELSIADIRRITAAAVLPVEVFVHGALCVAYSGQCLTSESIGGRSANRGQCAQACRLPYELRVDGAGRDLGDKAYLLSPLDLAAHDQLGELLAAGVVSFKIEGRLKSAHYVAAATQSYRAALDAALQGRSSAITPQQQADLAQSFSRGFGHGFLDGVDHQALVQGRFPKARGRFVGRVQSVSPQGVVVQLDPAVATTKTSAPALKPGDGVVFDQGHPEQDEQGGRLFAVQARSRTLVQLTFAPGAVNFRALEPGALVWKTDDPAVRRRLEQSFARDQVIHRRPLSLRLWLQDDHRLAAQVTDEHGVTATAHTEEPLQAARQHPLTIELAREQFSRLGDTPFSLQEVALTAGPPAHAPRSPLPVMAPKSVLNDLRRRVMADLLQQQRTDRCLTVADPDALASRRAEIAQRYSPAAAPSPLSLYVLVRHLAQLEAVLRWRSPTAAVQLGGLICDLEDPRLSQYETVRACVTAAGQALGQAIPLTLATLRIAKPGEDGFWRQLAQAQPQAVLIRNLGALAFFREQHPQLPLLGDYSLNVANEFTAALLLEAGLSRLTPSYDLNWDQLAALLRRLDPARFELVLHQHMPMFHMEHCVFAHTLSQGHDYHDCGRPCERHQVELRDRAGIDHPLVADAGCRNTVFNGVAQTAAPFIPRALAAGLRHFRIEFLRQGESEITGLLDRYALALAGELDPRRVSDQLHVLQVLGVTPGTYAHA